VQELLRTAQDCSELQRLQQQQQQQQLPLSVAVVLQLPWRCHGHQRRHQSQLP